jgi:hypothetical protein
MTMKKNTIAHTPPQSADLTLEVPNAYDASVPTTGIETRLRLGTARRDRGASRTEADLVRQVLAALPEDQRPEFSGDVTVLPASSDARADVKRSLRFDGPSGLAVITNGDLLKYLGSDEVSRILDGSFRVYAVDQASGAPKLSYLRLGKPEPTLGTDADGKPVEGSGTQLPKRDDRSKDTKYSSGVGIYTEGDIQGYSKGKTSLRASGPFYINSRGYVLTSYGERKAVSYDINSESDLNAINAGEIDDTDVERTLINVDWRYKRPDGWYTQVYDRGKRVDFYTSHKGEIGTSVKYGLSLGLSFNHAFAAGLDSGYAAMVEVKGGHGVKVTSNGFETDLGFGKFQVAESHEVSANDAVEISCARLVDVGMTKIMKGFSIAVRVSVAAQNAAFIAYEAALAARANMTLKGGQTADDLMAEDHHGFQTAFEQGPKVYNAAVALSAITCTAGILLAAVQAAMSKAPDPGTTPKIKMTPFAMVISAGPATSITLNAFGISIKGGSLGMRGIKHVVQSPKTDFQIG